MNIRQELGLLAELYDSPLLSEVSKQRVRRALNEAQTVAERNRVMAEVRVSLRCLLA
ncbi:MULTISPECIES: hypothetical protein [Uliginosibacterium]|uniref:Uncharacterized protein n=1 Tax=Uliginosibacterium aquaticum TaxID=2731212 RepID=A0ABX2ICY7_9RHOO|nr:MULTISPECIES: hypothetical protein [Uliginosibacterium]MDO6387041.1 hypothetical protein [Uliginosibacterium sp. 31-12]NSL54410.1 hypothetical protein [Uliginosibacterium aquaticum]